MTRLPAFINARAGTMQQAADALSRVGGFDVQIVEPVKLTEVLRGALSGTRRLVVAGGDGTIGTAAAVLCAADHATQPEQPEPCVELAIIPGGTLNHFARDHAIPTDMEAAAHLAHGGRVIPADVAFAGERLFLNTSAVGTYVTYVRLRNRLEKFLGYRVASVVAAIRLFLRMHSVRVELEVDGRTHRYETPLVFIGVGERELRAPEFGGRIPGGQHCLHVIVVRERRAARLLAVALAAMTRGIKPVAQTPELDSFLVDHCTIEVGRSKRVSRIATDGEIVSMQAPIKYRIARDALHIVAP